MAQAYYQGVSAELRSWAEAHPNQRFTLIFDGTTRVNKYLCMMVRFIDDSGPSPSLRHKVISLKNIPDGSTATVLATLQEAISSHSLGWSNIEAIVHDNNTVNGAVDKQPIVADLVKLGCFSHRMCSAGGSLTKRSVVENAFELIESYIEVRKSGLIRRGIATEWRNISEEPWEGYCPTRWWSLWKQYEQLLLLSDSLPRIFQTAYDLQKEGNPAAGYSGPLKILVDFFATDSKFEIARMEMAIVVDLGRPLAQACYRFEGRSTFVSLF
jgi:hypothetical protein